jgi:hypothetical protein
MRPKQKSSSKRRDYRQNKTAFDSVLSHLRKIGRPWLAPSHALNPEAVGGGARNPAKPSTVDFWADVFIAIKASIPRDIDLVIFHIAYTLYDSDEAIDRELWADKKLGGRRHSVEQRVGEEFVKRNIFPVAEYFRAERKAR